jgi:hypothetical protein
MALWEGSLAFGQDGLVEWERGNHEDALKASSVGSSSIYRDINYGTTVDGPLRNPNHQLIPSGKQPHNYGKSPCYYGKTHYFYGHFQ